MSATLENKKTDSKPFNYDLKKMQEAIAAPVYTMPSNLNFQEFQEWIKRQAKKG